MKPGDILAEYIPIEVTSDNEINEAPDDWYKQRARERQRREMSDDRYRYYTHSGPAKILHRYLSKDCVIAYIKDIFGAMFILKGKNKHFAFFCKNSNLYLGGMGYSIMDTGLDNALEMIEKLPEKYKNDKDKFAIIDEEEFQRMKKMILFEAIKEGS